jgi:hypothetical protein
MITGFEIHITDVSGTPLPNGLVTTVAKKAGYLDCCNAQLYNVSLTGEWPTDAAGFLIVPYSGSGNNKVLLPVGTAHTILQGYDQVAEANYLKAVSKVVLSGMPSDECKQLFDNPSVLVAAQVDLVNSKRAEGTAEITQSNCALTDIKECLLEATSGSRRLENHAGKASLEYTTETKIPTNFGVASWEDVFTSSTDDLIAKIQSQSLTQLGFTPNITGAKITVESLTNTEQTPSSDARRVAGSLLSSIVVLISTLAGPRFFA